MNELIKITEQNGRQVVSARELYEFLELKERFSKFIKRMFDYEFIEGIDYTPYQMVHPSNGQTMEDYALTLDTAKELSMLQRTPKGKQARLYFIECERIAKNGVVKLPGKRELALMVLESEAAREMAEEQVRLLTETIKEQAPKVQFVEEVLATRNTWPITLIATELGMSAIALNKKLQEKGVHRKVSGVWVLNSEYSDKEYTSTRTHTYTTQTGETRTSLLTVWTERGRAFIHQLLNEKLNKSLQTA